jgi:glycosyltransferase involved in cell wall biosynthesis
LRVGVLTTSYPSTPDDPAGHFVLGFAEWLAREVGEVEVLALDDGLTPEARLRSGGLPSQLAGVRGLVQALGIGARLTSAVARRAPGWDAIVSHWLVPCALVGAAFARGKRHLCIAHGSDVALLRRVPGGLACARSLARRCDLVYVADALRIDGAPGRVVAMPGRSLPLPARELARRALGIAPDEPRLVVLFVGRLVPEKGADLLLASLPEDVLALVVGDGPEHARLATTDAVRSGRARLLGARFGADLGACYAAADLLVVPSRRDGAPTVLAEARAARLPILATAVGGIPEALAGQGRLVAPDAAALRTALVRAFEEKNRLLRPGAPPAWAEIGPALWGKPSLSGNGEAAKCKHTANHLRVLSY